MKKKDAFIKIVKEKIFDNEDDFLRADYDDETIAAAISYWEDFQKGASSNAKEMTENGAKIIAFMQTAAPELTAKEIGEGLFVSGKSIAGSMKKLITDGYVEKVEGSKPIIYVLTEKGKQYNID